FSPAAAATAQPSAQTSKTAPRPTASTPPKKANLSKTFVFGSTGAVIIGDEKKAAAIDVPKPVNEAVAPPFVRPAEIMPPAVVRSEPPRPSPSVKSVPPPAVASEAHAASSAAPVASPPTLPGIEVLFKREQDPDA